MIINFLNRAIVFIISIIGIVLALLILIRNKKSKINRYFFFALIFLILWLNLIFLSYYVNFFVPQEIAAIVLLWVQRSVWFVLGPFFIFTYFFIIYFPKEHKRNKIIDKIIIIIWSILSLFCYTPWTVKSVDFDTQGMKIIQGGPFMYVWNIFGAGMILFILGTLYAKLKYLDGEEKNKTKYVFIAALITSATNIIFNIALPLLRGNFFNAGAFSWSRFLGDYSIVFVFIFVAIIILKDQIAKMKVIFTNALVISIAIIAFIQALLAETIATIIFSLIAFVLYSGMGFLLIKAIIKEEKRKIRLEDEVKNRTKELLASKEALETRARELEESKAILENKTAELKESKEILEERNIELEKWHKLMVDRELKMIELKELLKKQSDNNKES